MSMHSTIRCALGALMLSTACRDADGPDAYGNFEADELVIASETNGQLRTLRVTEGASLDIGEAVGLVDSVQLGLERTQLLAQREALVSARAEAAQQLEGLSAQREIAGRTWTRVQQLYTAGSATAQQRDQAERDVRVLSSQASAAALGLQRLDAERNALSARLAAVTDRLRRTTITNPVRGTVLAQYVRAGEIVQVGQPLYRIANLDTLTLRVYVSGAQLSQVRLGGAATVHIDAADGAVAERAGVVTWIASRAEFTPTPVQTRDERAELVYAVKLRVANPDGALKIGMPADVAFTTPASGTGAAR
ncbi:MAG: efflux RND transporter periplasmic adaptor subunit [Gemmatimonadaceae bacterium]|nr:efflux RND transporter periplasmic adaptor subunit [Gemmatimonadaceae bacterium]